MQKNKLPFTPSEQDLLRNCYISIARKNEVSGKYVSLIASGQRKTNTEKAKAILKDLKELLKLLKPDNH